MMQAYVETSKTGAVAVEGLIVELNELFCGTNGSLVRYCILSVRAMAV
jgi:hypothetical protein